MTGIVPDSFIRDVRESVDPPALWDVAVRWLKGQGVVAIAYHHFTGSLGSDPNPLVAIEGVPEEIVARYVGDKLYCLNPRADLLLAQGDPMDWNDLPSIPDIYAEIAPDFAEAVEALVHGEGLALPVFGPKQRNGTFGLAFGAVPPAVDVDLPRRLQLGCQLAHLRYCAMTAAVPDTVPALSPREKEVLAWIAKGKSNAAIASILGISPHTVDTHVRRLFEKLDVSDRTTAAVKGLGAGLVQPAPRAA